MAVRRQEDSLGNFMAVSYNSLAVVVCSFHIRGVGSHMATAFEAFM